MLKHYITVAFRNLWKYKTQSLISIIGLAVGFTCFALSVLWSQYENSYDSFHKEKENIYLVGETSFTSGTSFDYYAGYPLADYFKSTYPEIENIGRIDASVSTAKLEKDEVSYDVNYLGVDSGFVSLFQIKLLEGSPDYLRMNSNQIAISKEYAQRIFGEESPLGATVKLSGAEKTIGAVVSGWEGHSIFPFDVLSLIHPPYPDGWGMRIYYTVIRTHKNVDMDQFKEKLANFERIEQSGEFQHINKAEYKLIPLAKSRSIQPITPLNVGVKQIHIFSLTGILLILCGLFNYLTMFIIRIRMRGQELALRKVNGSSNAGLMSLLLTEFGLILLISFLLGLIFIKIALPEFIRLSQITESPVFFYKEIVLYYLVFVVITFCISALLINHYKGRTLQASINDAHSASIKKNYRRISLFVQLFISIGFIFSTIVMIKQIRYIHSSNEVGFLRHNIGNLFTEEPSWMDEIAQVPFVTQVIHNEGSLVQKSNFFNYKTDNWEGKSDDQADINLERFTIDTEFADFYSLKVLQGNRVNETSPPNSVMLNEAAVKAFGWDDPIGKYIEYNNERLIVSAILKDIYYESPLYTIRPAIYYHPKDIKTNPRQNSGRTSVIHFKFQEGKWKETKEAVEAIVKKNDPNNRIRLYNIEDEYNKSIESDRLLIRLLAIISIVCVIIAVFGVFSMLTLACEQRKKEIAIRKINGASLKVIFNLFFYEYFILLCVASVFAFSVGYYVIGLWLENYKVQTNIPVWIYAFIFLLLLIIILVSVSWRIVSAARENPAETLKTN